MRKVLLSLIAALMTVFPGLAQDTPSYSSIAEIIAASPDGEFTVDCDLTIGFRNNRNIFVTDGTDFIQIYSDLSSELVAGYKIDKGWTSTYTLFQSTTPELVPVSSSSLSGEESTFTAPVVKGSEISTDMVNSVVTIPEVYFASQTGGNKTNFNGTADGVTLSFRNNYGIRQVDAGCYDVKVVVNIYNGGVSLYVVDYVKEHEITAVVDDIIYTRTSYSAATVTGISIDKASLTKALITETVTIDGREYNVTAIDWGVFGYCTALADVSIPATVETLGDYAFGECKLKSVTIADASTSINFNQAFSGTTIESLYLGRNWSGNFSDVHNVTLGAQVTSIPSNAFKDSPLSEISIPATVETLGDDAFGGCELKSVTIADATTLISFNQAFSGTTIESLYLGRNWSGSFNDVHNVTLGAQVTAIPSSAFSNSPLSEISIPATVETIDDRAFSGCAALASVNLSDGLTGIGSFAFENCAALTQISIPATVETIGRSAFSGCAALASVNLTDGLTVISYSAFENCATLTQISIPATVKTIGGSAFSGCAALASVNLTDGLTVIGVAAFVNCTALTQISIPATVETVGSYGWTNGGVFYGCTSLETLIIADGDTELSADFEGCTSLKNLYLGRNCNYSWYEIPELSSVTLGTGITTIARDAFASCYNLASITIPANVTSIHPYAFQDCYALKTVSIEDSTEPLVFEQEYDQSQYYPYTKTYHSKWLENTGIENLYIGRPTEISLFDDNPVYLFKGKTSIKNLTIKNCDKIRASEFEGCTGLSEVSLLEGLTSIGGSAFSGCTAISQIDLPEGLTSIGAWAFEDCTALAQVSLPETLTNIYAGVFRDCSITELTIPASVTLIGAAAFANNQLASLTIADSDEIITFIEPTSSSFYNEITFDKNPLTELYIGRSWSGRAFPSTVSALTFGDKEITNIPREAFKGCRFESLSIPASVKDISSLAFADCASLSSVTVENGDSPLTMTTGTFNSSPVTDLVMNRDCSVATYYSYSFMPQLERLTVGEKVTQIPDTVFRASTNLITVKSLSSTPATAAHKAFPDNAWGIVADSDIPVYESAPGWEMLTYAPGADFGETPEVVENDGKTYMILSESTAALVKSSNSTIINRVKLNDKIRNIVAIGPGAFAGLGFYSITIPDQIQVIGTGAFNGCTNLGEINIPEGLTRIAPMCFKNTRLGSVTIPSTVTHIGYESFCNAGITDVTLPAGLASISPKAFLNTSRLSEIVIPDKVATIGSQAFMNCTALSKATLPAALESVSDELFANDEQLESITIPQSVTAIGEKAFASCKNINSVTMGDRVTTIGTQAFASCAALNSIAFSTGITTIGTQAFESCAALKSIALPDGITTIGEGAFKACSTLNTVNIPASLTEIATETFASTDISKIVIPAGVNSIGKDAFRNAGLDSLIINDSDNLLQLTEITNQRLDTLYMGRNWAAESPLSISKAAFGSKVTAIPSDALSGSITTLRLPASVSEIGENAFSRCTSLTRVEYARPSSIEADENIFAETTYANATLFIPTGSKSDYEMAVPWYRFNTIEEMEFDDSGMSGIEDIAADFDADEAVSIYDFSGRLVYSGRRGDASLLPGLYIVKGATRTVKVMVK